MFERFVRSMIESPALAVFAVVLLVVAGVHGYRTLPVDAVPDVTNVQVQVLTRAPGLSPLDVERLVTQPVELTLTGIPGLQRLRSVSRAAVSAVTLVFDDDVDVEHARELVAQRLPAAREAISADTGRPELGPLTTGLGEVYHFTVRWPGHSLGEVRTLLDWEIGYRLRQVPGVVEVNAWGGDKRQIEVRLRENAMLAARVTPEQIESAILAAGANVSAGSIERDDEATFVRADATYTSVEDIANQVVVARGPAGTGTPVLVRDLASVVDGAAPRFSAATADGKGETVYAMVQMIASGNAQEVVARVKQRLAEIQPSLPPGVVIEPFYDRANFVERVLTTVRRNLAEGGLVVALVLLIMLGDVRAGLIVASVIPLSMLGAFALMRQFGIVGNLLSLGAIDFGLVVDGAVVVVEGALSAMLLHGLNGQKAMQRVAAEVGRPVTLAVLIIAVVYLPVLMLEGVEGRMFRPMALTVLFAMATSLLLTFTWVPALGAILLKKAHSEPRVVSFLKARYRALLVRLVPRWGLSLLVLGVFIVLAALVARTRGAEFVPRLEEGDLAIQVTRPPSVSLAESVRGTTAVERALRQFPDVARVVSRIGSPDVATDVMGVEQADVIAILKPRDEWVTATNAAGFAAALEPVLRRELPGAAFGFTQPIEMRVQELIGGIRSDLGIKVFGDELPILREQAQRVARVLSATPGAEDVRVEPMQGLRLASIRPDPPRLGRLGVHSDELLRSIQSLRTGREVGRLLEGQRRFDVVLRADRPPLPDEDTLRELRIPLSEGRTVLLGDVAEVHVTDAPAQIGREQARRRVLVEANVRGRDLASFVREVQSRMAKLELPPGYYLEYGGQYENLARASERLAIIAPLTLGIVLFLLYLAFGALRPAWLVFVNIPAAVSGGVFALALRGLDFSVSAAVGFLALFGVATLNGVVLVAAIRHRAEGRPEAVEGPKLLVCSAATERLRPVLTTALVAALGFVPMAFSSGVGAEVQRPLATVVIGGLVTSTLCTLFLLPALYLGFGGLHTSSKSGSPLDKG